jgi:hypothetical protein
MNDLAAAGTILENYPGIDDLTINGVTVAELKENLEVPELTLAELEQVAQDSNDPLLLWVVREVKDGGEKYNKTHPGFDYDADLIRKVLERGRDDLNAIISAFGNS